MLRLFAPCLKNASIGQNFGDLTNLRLELMSASRENESIKKVLGQKSEPL